MNINELVKEAHENAKSKGFWNGWEELKTAEEVVEADWTYEENIEIGNRLMLIVSELAEAQEALRHGNDENFREEIADVAIRLGDLCGGLGIDLEAEIIRKMEINKSRGYKHGKAF